jgi:hypothetical protein
VAGGEEASMLGGASMAVPVSVCGEKWGDVRQIGGECED